jgi:PAT family beta-lactamase induction signal transducer AmpG
VVAPVVAALLLLVLFIRERPGERLMPWSPGAASPEARAMHVGAWKPVVMGVLQAMATRPALLFLLGSFLAAVGGGIGLGLIPLLGARELGWDSDRISSVSSTGNIVAAIAAVLLIGLIADRIGAKRCSMLMCGLAAALALAMLAARGHWHLPAVFMTFAILYLVLDVAISTCTCALAMRICVPAVGATQFSLFMAGANLGISAGAAMLGTLQAWGDLTAMMIGVAAAQIAAILCLMAARVGR